MGSFQWRRLAGPRLWTGEPAGFACQLVLESRSRSGRRLEPVKPPAGFLVCGRVAHRRAPLRPRGCGGAWSRDSGLLASAAWVHPSTGRTSAVCAPAMPVTRVTCPPSRPA